MLGQIKEEEVEEDIRLKFEKSCDEIKFDKELKVEDNEPENKKKDKFLLKYLTVFKLN